MREEMLHYIQFHCFPLSSIYVQAQLYVDVPTRFTKHVRFTNTSIESSLEGVCICKKQKVLEMKSASCDLESVLIILLEASSNRTS